LNTSGANNTFLGYQSGGNITTGSNNIIIGSGVDAPSASADNQLNIGNIIKKDENGIHYVNNTNSGQQSNNSFISESATGLNGTFSEIRIKVNGTSLNRSIIMEIQIVGYSSYEGDFLYTQYSSQAPTITSRSSGSVPLPVVVSGSGGTTYLKITGLSIVHPVGKVKVTLGGIGYDICAPTIEFIV
jgi:hypothetical protein